MHELRTAGENNVFKNVYVFETNIRRSLPNITSLNRDAIMLRWSKSAFMFATCFLTGEVKPRQLLWTTQISQKRGKICLTF